VTPLWAQLQVGGGGLLGGRGYPAQCYFLFDHLIPPPGGHWWWRILVIQSRLARTRGANRRKSASQHERSLSTDPRARAILAQNALFEVLSTSGNEDTTWEGLFLERKMLRDSTKDAGYFVWSIFNVFAIRRQRGSSGAGTTLARVGPHLAGRRPAAPWRPV
jgi:hypothetical protein